MSRCSDCKFWAPFGEELSGEYYGHLVEIITRGEAVKTIDPWETALDYKPLLPWGTCSREEQPPTPMFTVDGSGYFSALRTRHDFGCAAFEQTNPGDQ